MFPNIFRYYTFPRFILPKPLIVIENSRNVPRNERCDSTKAKELIFANRTLIIIDSCTNYALARNSRIREGGRRAIEGANEWKENRARAARTIINDHRLVLSSSHSCILADKSNVAQLTETNCRE